MLHLYANKFNVSESILKEAKEISIREVLKLTDLPSFEIHPKFDSNVIILKLNKFNCVHCYWLDEWH